MSALLHPPSPAEREREKERARERKRERERDRVLTQYHYLHALIILPRRNPQITSVFRELGIDKLRTTNIE
jgi:hypothetical protein